MMRALRFFPLLALLAACQPSPFAEGEKADQSFVLPLTGGAEGAKDAAAPFADGVVRYRIQNIRTLPFSVWEPAGQTRRVYLLRETQRMVANPAQETGIERSEIEASVFLQSPEAGDRTRLVWRRNFRADRAELITSGPFPLYRLTKLGCCGALSHQRHVQAATGAELGEGSTELNTVTLTDAEGDATRYVTVQPDITERAGSRPAGEAAILHLADGQKILASLRLLAPQAAPGETSLLEPLEGRKVTRLNARHDKAAIVLRSSQGASIRLPFDRRGFLADKAKLPSGWRAEKIPTAR